VATPSSYRPGRVLLSLALVLAALSVWVFWPGTSKAPQLGLDLQGGTQVILVPRVAEGETLTEDQVTQTVEIIRSRVDAFGVAEAEVSTQGQGAGSTIVVSIPGAESRGILESLRSTAKLTFRPVLAVAAGLPSQAPVEAPDGEDGEATASPTPAPNTEPAPRLPLEAATEAELATGFAALDCTREGALQGGNIDDPAKFTVTCDRDGAGKYLLGPAQVLGEEISNATANLPQTGAGGWEVSLELTSAGGRAFATATQQLSAQQSPRNQFAIVLDGLVVSAPQVNEPILGGRASITGNFTAAEANNLANVLKYGALPVTLDVASVANVTATLGQESLRAGLIAGGLGLILVVAYLLLYYRALGVVAVVSLLIAAFATYLAVVLLGRQLGFTLTLAAVAGLIVAIGITADSFIVYFERIRDEVREGKGLRAACQAAWPRARRTILVADGVAFLAAVVLYFLSVGNVRGFAFTLGLTTFLDVIVAFVFTRPVIELMARTGWFQAGSRMTGIDADRLGVDALPTATQRGRRVASRSTSTSSASTRSEV
jgi:preprotein translocase subunit SecD